MSCLCSWRASESRYITQYLLYSNILNLIFHTGQDQGKYCLLTSFFISKKFSLGIVSLMVFAKSCWIIEISLYFLRLLLSQPSDIPQYVTFSILVKYSKIQSLSCFFTEAWNFNPYQFCCLFMQLFFLWLRLKFSLTYSNILPSAWPIPFSVYFLPLYHNISAPWLNSHPRDFSSHSSCLLKDPFWTPFPTFSIMSSSHIFSVHLKSSYIVPARQNILFQIIKKKNSLPFFAVTVWFFLGTCSYSFSPQK